MKPDYWRPPTSNSIAQAIYYYYAFNEKEMKKLGKRLDKSVLKAKKHAFNENILHEEKQKDIDYIINHLKKKYATSDTPITPQVEEHLRSIFHEKIGDWYNYDIQPKTKRGKRPSPSTSASTVKVGTIRYGGDKKKWICKSYKRDGKTVKHWVHYKK